MVNKLAQKATDSAAREPLATLHGLIGAALVATIGLIGSPWVLDWEDGLVTIVNLVIAAWLAVGVFVVQLWRDRGS